MFAFAGQPCRRLDAAGKHNDQGWNSWQSSALSCWATARRTVITADPTWAIDGQPVARVGDQVTCPRCKRTTTIATSRFSNTIDSGRPVAFDQDTTDCGAVLYSRHNGHAGHDDGSSDTAAARATSSDSEVYTPREAPRFDEHSSFVTAGPGSLLWDGNTR